MIEVVEKIADALEWDFSEQDNYLVFQKYTGEGQDINLKIDKEDAPTLADIAREVQHEYDTFDVSEKTYVWLDNTGHGKNGAPNDMRDVYNDMEEAKKEFGVLAKTLLSASEFIEKNKEIEVSITLGSVEAHGSDVIFVWVMLLKNQRKDGK